MEITLYHADTGSGKPLILLHGNGEDGSYFDCQKDALARHFRVIALDTRGHGRSPRGTAPFTISQFAEDLRCFMDHQGIARASLLGFSDGGNIALTFALRYPERVDRLVLNGANLFPSGVRPSLQIPIILRCCLASLTAWTGPQARRRLELLRLMVFQPHIRPQALKGLTVPTLVIAGTRDMIRDSHTRRIHASLPNAELVILPGDHFIARSNAQAFREAVEAFLLRE